MAGPEAVGLAALGWLVSPVVKELVRKGITYLGSDTEEGFEDLKATLLPQFQITIEKFEKCNDKDKLAKLAKWLDRLKNAHYDAEAIVHELEYKSFKRKAKGDRKKKLLVRISSHPIIKPFAKVTSTVNKKTSPVTKPLRKLTRKVSQKVSMLSPQKMKLWGHLRKLKNRAAEAKDFLELLGIQPGNGNSVPAGNGPFETSSLLSHKVFGRDKVRDQIINFLLDQQAASSSTESYSVVAITGIGGAGKTTLAQYVYQDERVKNHFGVMRIWLCLSKMKDVSECIREMIEGVTGKGSSITHNLNALHEALMKILSESKSILLVLDDVSCDKMEELEWDNLLAPFASTGGRCKIVVTSRETLYPNALSRRKLITIKLSELAHDDFKSLFRYYAMDGLEVNDPHLKNDLCEIGDEIATKMVKSPLAAKAVGNQLRKQPEIKFWRDTLQNDILISTRKVLLWSYQHLDVQLQRCFLFCGVFPKVSLVNSGDELVNYWMALDFIQSSDIGCQYFNTMVANSMLQLVDGKYYMHDLFRDLAEDLSARDCFTVTNFEKEVASIALYAYIEFNNESWKKYLSSICNLRNLRALILQTQYNALENRNKLLPMVCTKFKNLRVLELWMWELKELPSVIGDLKNLRYLDVWKSSIEELPNSISKLYHLQFLILPSSIKTLPPKLTDLIRLRSIVVYDRNAIIVHTLPPIPYLGKLTSLQCLSEFQVRKEEGYELCQLESLNEIAGSLRIINLNNVRQKEEAIQARLFEKPKLKSLELVWAEPSKTGLDLEVIEGLKPSTNLEGLSIDGYGGSKCPSWLRESLFLKNIKHLNFYNCSELTDLPLNLHESCHYLTSFKVSKCLCLVFTCENELQLTRYLGNMEEYSLLQFEEYKYMKHVFDHEIKSFKQTCSAESCPEQLKIIEHAAEYSPEQMNDVMSAWWNCHQQRMNFLFKDKTKANKLTLPSMLCVLEIRYCYISDGALSDCLRGMAALKELYLEGIMTITTLPQVQVLKSLQSLRVLEIISCWCLRSVGGLHALPHLEKFKVDSCWSLSDLVELPPTLQSFFIYGGAVFQKILYGNLKYLEFIEISKCLVETHLSFGHLISLKSLHIINSPGLHQIGCSLVQRSFIDSLALVLLPNLSVESVLESWQGCRELYISSSAMLNELLSPGNFDTIEFLVMQQCHEETISFEKPDNLQSIKTLSFSWCHELKQLPSNLSDLSNLENIHFLKCSKISSLPELPKSIREIGIEDCPVLKKRCQPNGPEWHKIQHIQRRSIE